MLLTILQLQVCIQKVIDQKHIDNRQRTQQMTCMGFMAILKTNLKTTMVTIRGVNMFTAGLRQIQLCTNTLKIRYYYTYIV